MIQYFGFPSCKKLTLAKFRFSTCKPVQLCASPISSWGAFTPDITIVGSFKQGVKVSLRFGRFLEKVISKENQSCYINVKNKTYKLTKNYLLLQISTHPCRPNIREYRLIGSQAFSFFNFVKKIENAFPIFIGWPQTAKSRFVERCHITFGQKLVQRQTPFTAWNHIASVDSLGQLFVLLLQWTESRLSNMGTKSIWWFDGGDDQNTTLVSSVFFNSLAYKLWKIPHLVN